jgi:ATP-dependent DNA ligase
MRLVALVRMTDTMGKETIELFKQFEDCNFDKYKGPWGVQEKLDGVPILIRREAGSIKALTRQGEYVSSLDHILEYAVRLLLDDRAFIVGEVYCRGMPFKDISGLVRAHKAQDASRNLRLYVFDGDIWPSRGDGWLDRQRAIALGLTTLAGHSSDALLAAPIQSLPYAVTNEPAFAHELLAATIKDNPQCEGVVLHDINKTWQPGKRLWTGLKLKPKPTIDLKVVGFEEAISKHGEPMGMVGRINCELNTLRNGKLETSVIGVGPGALTHTQRRGLWSVRNSPIFWAHTRIAEVQYMKDDTYDALRQPVFVRFRGDKSEPDCIAKGPVVGPVLHEASMACREEV